MKNLKLFCLRAIFWGMFFCLAPITIPTAASQKAPTSQVEASAVMDTLVVQVNDSTSITLIGFVNEEGQWQTIGRTVDTIKNNVTQIVDIVKRNDPKSIADWISLFLTALLPLFVSLFTIASRTVKRFKPLFESVESNRSVIYIIAAILSGALVLWQNGLIEFSFEKMGSYIAYGVGAGIALYEFVIRRFKQTPEPDEA